ncbi:MAG: DUF423 domain-containing protein [Polyangiaceae bacterium]
MSSFERPLMIASGISGFLAVALGAFGAHGLKSRLADLPDGPQRLEWWHTGAQYQAVHTFAIALAAYLATRSSSSSPLVAGVAFIIGILIFSGSLYTMTLTGIRVLGAITPIGGVSLLVGWIAVIVTAWRME